MMEVIFFAEDHASKAAGTGTHRFMIPFAGLRDFGNGEDGERRRIQDRRVIFLSRLVLDWITCQNLEA